MAQDADRSVGDRIRDHRRAIGLTQRQLADAAGLSIGMVRDLEQGITTRPHAGSVDRLTAVLGLGNPRADGRASGPLSIGVLGPLTVLLRGHPVPVGYGKSRALLGLLALHANAIVHRDAIIEALWGDQPPTTAVAMVQRYLSRLRRLIGARRDRLVSSGPGYCLRIDADELDMPRFDRLAAQAHAATEYRSACALYAKALALWRGEPVADVASLRDHPVVVNLGQRYASVVIGYADASAELGAPEQALPALRELVAREPLHERAQARLIIALAGSGRQAAALRAFDAVRRRLDDELGVRPSDELAGAYQRVLRV